jgi:hypothetical protein
MGIGKPKKNFPAEIVLKKSYMEIGKRYRFREVASLRNHEMGNLACKEFLLTGIGRINVHYQVIGQVRIRTLPKLFWNVYVQGEVYSSDCYKTTDKPQCDSKLVFKFV